MASRYGLEIRAATGADAPGLAALLATCGRLIPPRDLADRVDGLRRDQGAALVAVAWGPPSGLVLLHWYRTLDAAPVAQITTLLVGPDDRRRGVGRLLLKAAAQAARSAGCGSLHLLAEADEPALRAFCAATGFTETGTRFDRPLRKVG